MTGEDSTKDTPALSQTVNTEQDRIKKEQELNSSISIDDIWSTLGFIIVFFILVLIPVTLYYYSKINDIIELFFVSIIVIYVGAVLFYYFYIESSTPVLWEIQSANNEFTISDVVETVSVVKKAKIGSLYNQYLLRNRIRKIVLSKLQKDYDIKVDRIEYYKPEDLMKITKSNILTKFLLTKDALPESNRWSKKKDTAEWDNILKLINEVQKFVY